MDILLMKINDLFDIEDDQDVTEDLDFDSKSIPNVVVSSNDWTTETIIRQIEKGNIILNPDFQRRDAWNKKKKSQFIESLILGLPIPQIVLAESKDQKGKYIVLDGKQRLLSLRQFTIPKNSLDYEKFNLQGLDIRKKLNKKSYEDLSQDIELSDDFSSFENQPIRTVVIKNWMSEDFLYLVFLRLNTGSVPLSTQELRQALHPGEFIKFLNEKSMKSQELKHILGLKDDTVDFRMRDTELLLRYFAFKNFIDKYTGNLKSFLDSTCYLLNKAWLENLEKKEDLENQFDLFTKAHSRIVEIFGKNAYRKWNKVSYESRFNRAIYDIMILTFSDQEVLKKTEDNKLHNTIEKGFKDLCSNKEDFLKSLETTTKSLSSTQCRINTWSLFLNETIGTNLPKYTLVSD
jgi:hypothetical protein